MNQFNHTNKGGKLIPKIYLYKSSTKPIDFDDYSNKL